VRCERTRTRGLIYRSALCVANVCVRVDWSIALRCALRTYAYAWTFRCCSHREMAKTFNYAKKQQLASHWNQSNLAMAASNRLLYHSTKSNFFYSPPPPSRSGIDTPFNTVYHWTPSRASTPIRMSIHSADFAGAWHGDRLTHHATGSLIATVRVSCIRCGLKRNWFIE